MRMQACNMRFYQPGSTHVDLVYELMTSVIAAGNNAQLLAIELAHA